MTITPSNKIEFGGVMYKEGKKSRQKKKKQSRQDTSGARPKTVL